MIQLLIVDDEAHVVDRLQSTIDWASIGIEQVFKAYSGKEALELLEQMSIDIVITDIQMPGISGLQLIAEINRRWAKTKCILLSGYSDFNYAKEAILQGSEDYLLKPVTEQALLATVSRVMEKLQKEWETVISTQRLTYTFKENLPLLRGNLLNDLLQGHKISEHSLREKMHILELPDYHEHACVLMMVRLESDFLEYDTGHLSLMEYAISNMADELFAEKFDSWHTKDAHDYLVFVMKHKQETPDKEDSAWLERTASVLQSAVKNYLKGKISILLSSWGEFPSEMNALYNSSLSAFRKRIGSEHELFMRLGDESVQTELSALQKLYEPPTLNHLLEAARWEDTEEKLSQIFDEMEVRFSESQEHLLEVYFSIASAFAYIAHKNGRQLHQLIGGDYDRMMEGIPFRTVNQLREWSIRSLQRMKEDMDQERQDSRATLIKDIRSFIDQHLASDVSLQSIADHVYMHPVYISKIYKLETGENLSDYVNHARMDKAAYLLKNGQDKIYEIATQLGYQRPHSFNHAFKKHYGMTPQEYRDQYS
ncbi:two-component system response regulator YesN [Paenibacillus sp. V4I3]|uniref:response regulator n=1 Tax=unclassified Paenibacillus TaxID=185978 RepID=UPI002789E1A1|nr:MULTISPECIES: response regulator [unclassified Paenibacillus]MDQ0871846.1 two-component system response regulator YesN [Paenibacillus sp. V4I3]MDQ0892271.1 two-component system response regulator YesN [Paenibacillus sp. V4I9]